MKVVISIVEYNTVELLLNCLKTLKEFKNDIEVWVLDNDSKDNSVEMIKKEFPKVHLIESKINLGFGGGHNQIFEKVESDYYLVLNSDTEVKSDAIDQMIDFMESNPNCGIASCKVLGFDGKLQPNGGDLPFGIALLGWLFNLESFGLKSPTFHRDDADYYKDIHEVGWVSGSFMMIKKEVLRRDTFSKDYFMYFEDVELCFRARKAGFKVMINPKVSIRHKSGGSLDDPKFRQWSGELIGLMKFYENEYGKVIALIIRLIIYISTVLRLIAFTFMGKLNYAKTYAKVIFSI